MTEGRMTLERWGEITYWPLIAASFAFLIAYSWRVIADLEGPARTVADVTLGVTWAIFAVDYIVRLSIASPRGAWFRKHIFDLLVVALPALRPLRLLRAFTLVHVLQRTVGTALRSRIIIYGVGATAILIWIAALSVLEAERGVPGANITHFGDAVWWAFVTVTTVGYGDYTPITTMGRFVAVGLMAGGVAVVGIVTATLSSWVIEKASAGHDDDEPATRKQVRVLATQITDLAQGLSQPPPEKN